MNPLILQQALAQKLWPSPQVASPFNDTFCHHTSQTSLTLLPVQMVHGYMCISYCHPCSQPMAV